MPLLVWLLGSNSPTSTDPSCMCHCMHWQTSAAPALPCLMLLCALARMLPKLLYVLTLHGQ